MTDDLSVLAAALRRHAGSVGEVAEAAHIDESAAADSVARLEQMGLVRVVHDVVTYRRPELTVAEAIARSLEETSRSLADATARSREFLRSLPELVQAWDAGETTDSSLTITTLEGPWALADMWRLITAKTSPRSALICLPDTEILRDAGLEYEETLWAARARDEEIRVVLSVSDTHRPLNVDRMRGELAEGTQIRMHPYPPSHFWVTDHAVVTLPLEWGDTQPTRVMSVRSPALASAFTWIFDRVWDEAHPVMRDQETWEPMVQLLVTGMTVESAARHLGLTARTGRRRVEAAMRHYGVIGQCALGAAWGADTSRRRAGRT